MVELTRNAVAEVVVPSAERDAAGYRASSVATHHVACVAGLAAKVEPEGAVECRRVVVDCASAAHNPVTVITYCAIVAHGARSADSVIAIAGCGIVAHGARSEDSVSAIAVRAHLVHHMPPPRLG